MIYLDNAATTLKKPPEVAQAIVRALDSFGGVGRGVHAAALAADASVFEAREAVAVLLGVPSSSQVAFTSNATEALNTALAGLTTPGDHVVTTAASHNSILRPLYRLRDEGRISLSIAPIAQDGSLDYEAFEALLEPRASLVAVTHASNLTGDVYDVGRIARIAHRHQALCVVDAAQTAGAWPLSMQELGADVVCFTGHKGMFGPQGTGGLCVAKGVDVRPLKVGGSGTHSFDARHPEHMPERLEAGTLNAHGIAGLHAGVSFVLKTGVDAICRHDVSLAEAFRAGVQSIDGVSVLGGGADARMGIVALNVAGIDSGELAYRLDSRFGICARAGAHCAPLMHKAVGSELQGAVRFSFSYFNTKEEVDLAIDAVAAVADAL